MFLYNTLWCPPILIRYFLSLIIRVSWINNILFPELVGITMGTCESISHQYLRMISCTAPPQRDWTILHGNLCIIDSPYHSRRLTGKTHTLHHRTEIMFDVSLWWTYSRRRVLDDPTTDILYPQYICHIEYYMFTYNPHMFTYIQRSSARPPIIHQDRGERGWWSTEPGTQLHWPFRNDNAGKELLCRFNHGYVQPLSCNRNQRLYQHIGICFYLLVHGKLDC